jgi:uncharacterized protein YdbL (DUF1318 family)
VRPTAKEPDKVGSRFDEKSQAARPQWARTLDSAKETGKLAHKRQGYLGNVSYEIRRATACSHNFAGHYTEALSWAQAATGRQPNYAPVFRILAASSAMAGQLEQARTAMTRLRELYPLLRVSKVKELFPLRSEDIARWAEGLRKAGLPE